MPPARRQPLPHSFPRSFAADHLAPPPQSARCSLPSLLLIPRRSTARHKRHPPPPEHPPATASPTPPEPVPTHSPPAPPYSPVNPSPESSVEFLPPRSPAPEPRCRHKKRARRNDNPAVHLRDNPQYRPETSSAAKSARPAASRRKTP